MKKHTYSILILLAVLATGCELNEPRPSDDRPCGPKTCTEEFASITVKFVDKIGNTLAVNDFKSINSRTGLAVKYAGPYPTSGAASYTVANDSDLKEFSETGDEVVVSGTNPVTGQVKTASFTISGGCACHIHKVSGPTQIAFDELYVGFR